MCFVGDSIYIYITMSINDEKVNKVNADMVMNREKVYMDYYEFNVYGISFDTQFSRSASLYLELCTKRPRDTNISTYFTLYL